MNVNIYEAKTKLSHLVGLVQAGEEVIISKAGKPVARLVSYQAPANRVPGRLAGLGRVDASFFEPLPADLQAFFE
jgi:prevent-host-death family protein